VSSSLLFSIIEVAVFCSVADDALLRSLPRSRCTEYRGASIPFSSCLNLTHRQYTAQTKPDSSNVPAANGASAAQRPHQGHPLAAPGRAPAAGMFKPTPHPNAGQPPVQLLQRGPSRPANANQGSFGQVAQGFKPPPVAPAQAHLK
jgi:hypothetical protein